MASVGTYWLAVGSGIGLLGGMVAAHLCDSLPRRHGITHGVQGRPRSRRNAAVLLLAAILGGTSASLTEQAFSFSVNLTIALALLTAAAIDFEHMFLPNELTLGAAGFALVMAPWRPLGIAGSLAGAVTSFVLTVLPFILYKRLRGHSGMGLGDAKLAIAAGAWLGPSGALFVVFAGAIQSGLGAIVLRLSGVAPRIPVSVQEELATLRAKADAGDSEAKALLADDPMAHDIAEGTSALGSMRLPWGPFLVLASFEFFVAQQPLSRLLLGDFNALVSPHEDEKRAVENVMSKALAHESAERVEALSHVDWLRIREDTNHPPQRNQPSLVISAQSDSKSRRST